MIAIAGGSGSGKTVLAEAVRERIGEHRCLIISQDSYYHDMSGRFDVDGGRVNFDHPDAIEFPLLAEHLSRLKAGATIEVPRYDFTTHSRLDGRDVVAPVEFVLLDGSLILTREDLRQHFDSSVFISAPDELRLERRLDRDTRERGRQVAGVQAQWAAQVQPMHARFVEQSAMHATRIVSGEATIEESAHAIIADLQLDPDSMQNE